MRFRADRYAWPCAVTTDAFMTRAIHLRAGRCQIRHRCSCLERPFRIRLVNWRCVDAFQNRPPCMALRTHGKCIHDEMHHLEWSEWFRSTEVDGSIPAIDFFSQSNPHQRNRRPCPHRQPSHPGAPSDGEGRPYCCMNWSTAIPRL
jgi:hypothetical protein